MEKLVDVILEMVVRIHFVACTQLYEQFCLSVGPSVGPFVHLSLWQSLKFMGIQSRRPLGSIIYRCY